MSQDIIRARIEANGARVTALRTRLGPNPSATLGGLLRDAEAAQAAAEASLAGPDAETLGATHAAETEDHLAFLERALAGTR